MLPVACLCTKPSSSPHYCQLAALHFSMQHTAPAAAAACEVTTSRTTGIRCCILLQAVDEETNKGAEYALADANSILSSACNGGPDGSCSLMTVGHIGVKDIHFSIDQSKLGEWIADVKEVIDKDLHNSGAGFLDELLHKNKRECLPPGYFWRVAAGRGSHQIWYDRSVAFPSPLLPLFCRPRDISAVAAN